MTKKNGKNSTPVQKRIKAPKRRATAADAAPAEGPETAAIEVGKMEAPTVETADTQTTPVNGAGSGAPEADADAATTDVRRLAQTAKDAPQPDAVGDPAAASAGGDLAVAEATLRPKGRSRTRALKAGLAEAAPKLAKPSALDAAAKILAEEGRAMGCQEMIGAMAAKGYWTSPGGKTPAATLHSAILMETRTKATQSRFTKTERGKFDLAVRE